MKSSIAWIADHAAVLLAVGGAVALLLSLWLPWFVTSPDCAQEPGVLCPRVARFSAWDSFRIADAALAALAGLAIVVALAGPRVATLLAPLLGLEPALARAFAGLGVAATGWSALCVSLYAIERPKPLPFLTGRVPDTGYFIALLACGAIVGGGWWEHRTSARR